MSEPSEILERARAVLREVYGYEDFRGPQAEIVETVAAGQDALVLMPTGGGKSLCYQIPSLLRPGLGVVISPLIALMEDQVTALREVGVRAAYLNSSLDSQERRQVQDQIRAGELDMVYVAPERLVMGSFLSLLDDAELALFAIDEAHCVSQWGHDFRPEYRALDILERRYPGIPRVALTATADAETRVDIAERLHLSEARRFVASFDRPNIRYTVVDKDGAKEQLLRFIQERHQGDAGIVYCLSRKSVEDTAAWLAKREIDALAYHAGLSPERRRKTLHRFVHEEGLVVCATIAFGMGIDKPDVRFVAHLDVPKSPEAYYQETGRAGRDGEPADAFMTYGLADVVAMRKMLARSEGGEQHKRAQAQKLDALLAYCEAATCRRQRLLAYFGEVMPEPCGNCDICLDPPDRYDGTEDARKFLSAVYRTGQRFGAGHVTDVLRGKESPKIIDYGHHLTTTFGIGADRSARDWRAIARQLVAMGYLDTDREGYGVLHLTEAAGPLLKGEETVMLRTARAPKRRKRGSSGSRSGGTEISLAPEDAAADRPAAEDHPATA